MTKLTFNVIYTPGTVRLLSPFALSLVEQTSCSFRLVANGCDDPEMELLERLCATSDHLDFYRYPSDSLVHHGTVLTALQRMERSERFCFMDSDIFATGDFAKELTPWLEDYAAIFSGLPVWSVEEDRVAKGAAPAFAGPRCHTENGLCIGLSYFAIYSNPILCELIDSTGATFERYRPFDDLPPELRQELQDRGAKARSYDTGKLLNVLLACRGERVAVRDLRSIRHIGGLSVQAKRQVSNRPWLKLGTHRRPWSLRRSVICHYLEELLHALAQGVVFEAELPIDEPDMVDCVRQTERDLIVLYRNHADRIRELITPCVAQRVEHRGGPSRVWGAPRRAFAPSVRPLRGTGHFVLGMHRSGTSCLTGLLEIAGLWVGDVPRTGRYNARGNFENRYVRAVNREIFARLGGSWQDPPRSIAIEEIDPRPLLAALEPYRAHEWWAVKDPRMLFSLDAWLPHVSRHCLVGTFRHPLAVARSLECRNGIPLSVGVRIWCRYNARLAELHRHRAFPLIHFGSAPEVYLRSFEALCAELGLRFDAAAAAAFHDETLISHEDSGFDGLDDETVELYRYLLDNQAGGGGVLHDARQLSD